MNYIGSKYSLLTFIEEGITNVAGRKIDDKIFCDLFAGTGMVGRFYKSKVKSVISNDLEDFSFILNKNYIENTEDFDYENLTDQLNDLEGQQGFIFHEYSENGTANRLYFSEYNGKKIDAIREKIEYWKTESEISLPQYYFLLASLIESSDKIANTASVYGAFLKKLKKTAQKNLLLQPAIFELTDNQNLVYQEDSNTLIKKISGDILYLDPPYNSRQYGANYHLLNTIALYDSFLPKGKTGLRNYRRSKFCSKRLAVKTFEDLIKNADFQYIFLSYNNEGLMPQKEILSILKKYGKADIFIKEYHRFRADKADSRHHMADITYEHLYILEK